MRDRVKINITYTNDLDLKDIMQALKPLLKAFKMRKNNTLNPYKHAYITIQRTA